MSLEEKDEKKDKVLVAANMRFAGLQKLETIFLAAPHQYELQKLTGSAVAGAFENVENEEEYVEVIEIGIGKGFTSLEILKAGDKVRIKGVDNDPGMIRQATENLKEYIQSGRLELQEKEAFEFLQNIPDNSVAIVASGFMLHNLQKNHRGKIIGEIFRILRPGGEFITADKIMPDNEEELRKETGWQMEQFQNIPDKKIREEWSRHYEDDMKPEIILKESEFTKMLREAGFREISITNRMHLDALARAVK